MLRYGINRNNRISILLCFYILFVNVTVHSVLYSYHQTFSLGLTFEAEPLYTIKNGTFIGRHYYKCSNSFGGTLGNYCPDQIRPGNGCSCSGINYLTHAHYAHTDVFDKSKSYLMKILRAKNVVDYNRVTTYYPNYTNGPIYCDNDNSTFVPDCYQYIFQCPSFLDFIRNNSCNEQGTFVREVEYNIIPKNILIDKNTPTWDIANITQLNGCSNVRVVLPVNDTMNIVYMTDCYYEDNHQLLINWPIYDYLHNYDILAFPWESYSVPFPINFQYFI